jgi:protein TonB
MLHPFVSLPGASRNLTPVLALSASVHAGLLYAALTSTGVVRRPHLPQAVAELVRFAELPVRRSPSLVRRANVRGEGPGRVLDKPELELPPLPLSFDLLLPDPVAMPDFLPDYTAVEIEGSGVGTDDVLHLGLGRGGGSSRLPAGAPYGAYDELTVEKPAIPVGDNPKPRYPSHLVSRGVETNFNVTFVVDTSGSVDRATVELPRSVREEFTSAVADVLFSWRFVPAELGGRRVRQRVLQPFIFKVERQYSSYGRD